MGLEVSAFTRFVLLPPAQSAPALPVEASSSLLCLGCSLLAAFSAVNTGLLAEPEASLQPGHPPSKCQWEPRGSCSLLGHGGERGGWASLQGRLLRPRRCWALKPSPIPLLKGAFKALPNGYCTQEARSCPPAPGRNPPSWMGSGPLGHPHPTAPASSLPDPPPAHHSSLLPGSTWPLEHTLWAASSLLPPACCDLGPRRPSCLLPRWVPSSTEVSPSQPRLPPPKALPADWKLPRLTCCLSVSLPLSLPLSACLSSCPFLSFSRSLSVSLSLGLCGSLRLSLSLSP